MRKFLYKIITVSFLSLFLISIADASWMCQMSNARGQIFRATGHNRNKAAAHVMKFCSKHSRYATNCRLDWCNHR